ncbi:Dyp-type peroxidase domain-containing protein [Sphingomonas lenta]|uniref:Dyp-type peroxidase C-terminal domain-containing protein n=1 Tax=Sphingomonas lenta TaxID=1141887 RepID=A0A2A2SCG5_9SPHN|nr:Dyp-type peroxidase domain-containing protein [Sphingomonas lenta]PAX06994.1 hypothetical protein CKY28_13090 [Sphingomonas lenta]
MIGSEDRAALEWGRRVREKPRGLALGGASDLVVVAPLRTGLVQSYESVTPATRMALTLRTLAAIRTAARESSPVSAFSDPVERLEQVQSFRIAILPDPSRMVLAVTFDGSWEAYMRALWRDAGPMLDLVFCNCQDYPLAREASPAEWAAWVRENERPAQYFYSAAPLTAGDLAYLGQAERIQRHHPARDGDLALTGLASLDPRRVAREARSRAPAAVVDGLALSVLGAMFRLTRYYGADARDEDALTLLRAANSMLDEWEPTRTPPAFAKEVAWLRSAPGPAALAAGPRAAPIDRADVQKGVLTSFDTADGPMTHGALLFLQVTDPGLAAETLADLPLTSEADAPADEALTLALTYEGLMRLGADASVLGALPSEFRQGAEARAALLGDVRAFHPSNWRRPRRNWPPGRAGEIDLSSIDVVLQYRARAPGDPSHDAAADPRHPLAARVAEVAALPGLRLLGVQSMRRAHDRADIDHLGLRDGISQPELVEGRPPDGPHEIAPDELLLQPADGPGAALLGNGSFLAMRRMPVHPDAYRAMVDAAAARARLSRAAVQAKLLGRRADGAPTVPGGSGLNDFTFDSDPHGDRCPLQSHIRRANPRSGRPPRIMRRGMSFGPPAALAGQSAERGIMFMAYCASLAQQYELIQSWVNGGNSTRIASCLADPLVGPARDGGDVYRFRHEGSVRRVALAPAARPVTTLDWTLYAFAPAISAVRALPSLRPPPPEELAEQVERGEALIARLRDSDAPAEAWQSLIDDVGARQTGDAAAFWAAVRARHGGALPSPLGLLVGSEALVRTVLGDDGRRYSVRGYDERFSKSVGRIYLGFDARDAAYRAQAPAGNAVIGAVDEETAFRKALAMAGASLRPHLEGPARPVNLLTEVVDPFMAGLCADWFGLPDGAFVKADGLDWRPSRGRAALCPGDLYSPARYVFDPTPSAPGVAVGQAHGRLLAEAVRARLRSGPPLTGAIAGTLAATPPFRDDPDLLARTVAGVMIGFVPVTAANLANIFVDWAEKGELFRVQEDWLAEPDEAARRRALRDRIERSIVNTPAPDFVWRTAAETHELNGETVEAGTPVLLAIQSATADALAAGRLRPDLAFGGAAGRNGPPHACPGRAMGMGTLVGFFAALLGGATLRPGAAPLTATLRPLG